MSDLRHTYPGIERVNLLSPVSLSIVSGVPSAARRVWRSRGYVPFDLVNDAGPASRHWASFGQAAAYALMGAFAQCGLGLEQAGRVAGDARFADDDFLFRDRRSGSPLLVFALPAASGFAAQTGSARVVDTLDAGLFVSWSALQRKLLERFAPIHAEVMEEVRDVPN
jgi:hypothetical protein